MNFFRSRAAALVLAAVCVCGSIVLNTRAKLGSECQKLEDTFYTSATNVKSIYSRLDQRADAANGLWTIAQKYGDTSAAALSTARQVLVAACENRDIPSMYDANAELDAAFTACLTALGSSGLADNDKSAVRDYADTFAGAQKMIDEANYNSDVRSFVQKTYGVFPADVLASISGVDAPALYE